MATDFTIKRDDTLPAIQATLTDSSDPAVAVNLAGASVRFVMRDKATQTEKTDAVATIVTAASGIVKYQWVAADTDTAGAYQAEWEVTFAGGAVETFPNYKHMNIKIFEDIGGAT